MKGRLFDRSPATKVSPDPDTCNEHVTFEYILVSGMNGGDNLGHSA